MSLRVLCTAVVKLWYVVISSYEADQGWLNNSKSTSHNYQVLGCLYYGFAKHSPLWDISTEGGDFKLGQPAVAR